MLLVYGMKVASLIVAGNRWSFVYEFFMCSCVEGFYYTFLFRVLTVSTYTLDIFSRRIFDGGTVWECPDERHGKVRVSASLDVRFI